MNRFFKILFATLIGLMLTQAAEAATLKAHKTLYGCGSNTVCYERIKFEIATGKDLGTAIALDIATAGEKLVVVGAWATVKTACASGGSATLKWGVTGDDDRFMNTTQGAVASLTAAATIVPPALEGTPNVLPTPYVMASGDTILQTVGTATMTGCVIEYLIAYQKP